MSILENELVKKYFAHPGFNDFGSSLNRQYHDEAMALRILKAMEEPIKGGERYLYDRPGMGWGEETALYDFGINRNLLRLPDQFQCRFNHGTGSKCDCFQPSREKCYCEDIEKARSLGAKLCLNWEMPQCPVHKKPDPIVGKIKELHTEYMCQVERGGGSYATVQKLIDELVELVRKEK